MIYEQVVEKLLKVFAGEEYLGEIVEAKKEFFEDAGILNDESSQFELRMTQFLDWYLLSRELSQHQVPPVALALHVDLGFSQEEQQLIENLNEVRHSIFEFLKNKNGDIYVKDLFSDKKYILKNSLVDLGFNHDELFEARIIPYGDNYLFAKGFCFHPTEAKKFIVKEIKKVKKLSKEDQEALILRLLKMRYKHEQYAHIRLDYIYTNDMKLKF